MSNRKLRARIVEKYGTASAFSGKMGMTQAKMSSRLNGKSKFQASEIKLALELLDIPATEIWEFFS